MNRLSQILLGSLALSFATVAAKPSTPSKYIGFKGQKLPKELIDYGGYLLQADDKNKLDYGVAHVSVRKSKKHMLWLQRFSRDGEAGTPTAQVVAAIELPTMHRTDELVLGECMIGGKIDVEISAIVVPPKTEVEIYTKITHAWRANRQTNIIEKIQTTNITCINEGYGAD